MTRLEILPEVPRIELEPQRGMPPTSWEPQDARPHRSAGPVRLAALQRAIQNCELTLHFQPIVSLEDGRAAGVEGRLTWLDPLRGVRPAGDFMEMAYRHGLLPALIRAQFEQACGLVETLTRLPLGAGRTFVAINVPARHLSDRPFIDDLVEILGRTGTDPSLLTVELCDLTSLSGRYGIKAALNTLRAEGLRLALGHFGGGASSMRDLRDLPFTEVKIDSSYVCAIDESSEDLAMVSSMVALAHALGLACTAEGVADVDAASTLVDLGCDLGQGHLWGPAVPEQEVEALLRDLPDMQQLCAATGGPRRT